MSLKSNIYGFDFLKSDHVGATTDTSPEPPSSQPLPQFLPQFDPSSAANKSDLEKQFDVIQFLQTHRSSGCLPPSIIYKSTGVDLSEGGYDEKVAQMVVHNKKIRIEEIPDPENPLIMIKTYGYQAKFNNISDKIGLLAQINRCKNGVSLRDLSDAYIGVEVDLAALITAGDVVAVDNPEDKDKTLFPRGEPFFVELDGNLFLPGDEVDLAREADKKSKSKRLAQEEEEKKESTTATNTTDSEESDDEKDASGDKEDIAMAAYKKSRMAAAAAAAVKTPTTKTDIVKVDVDPRKQIRRGEAIWIGSQWFRVSSAVREGLALSEQPARAQARPSVVMLKDLSKKNDVEGYIKPLSLDQLPLDAHLNTEALQNIKEAKKARENLTKSMAKLKNFTGTSGTSMHHHHLLKNMKNLANKSSFFSSSGANSTASAMLRKRPNTTSQPDPTEEDTLETLVSKAQNAISSPSLLYSHARRHGCTKDVREMYFATRQDVPTDEVKLYHLLQKTKLIGEDEPMCRPPMVKKRMNVDNDGKPKKRRYYERKNQRITNTHLQGTEIGAALARAAERQQQGKSVGDGGM